jgi:hypothetical protein
MGGRPAKRPVVIILSCGNRFERRFVNIPSIDDSPAPNVVTIVDTLRSLPRVGCLRLPRSDRFDTPSKARYSPVGPA